MLYSLKFDSVSYDIKLLFCSSQLTGRHQKILFEAIAAYEKKTQDYLFVVMLFKTVLVSLRMVTLYFISNKQAL